MKRVVAAAAVCVLFFCGCQGGELDETMLTYTNELSKVNEIDVIPDDAPDIVETLSGEEELENFVETLGLSKWKESALSQEAEKSGTFSLREIVTAEDSMSEGADTGQVGVNCIGEIFVYKSVPYVSVRIADTTLSFEVPEETAEYLNGYFE